MIQGVFNCIVNIDIDCRNIIVEQYRDIFIHPILGIAAITPNLAMAFATLNHATQTIMQIFTGGIALAMISRAKVRRMSHSEGSEQEKD